MIRFWLWLFGAVKGSPVRATITVDGIVEAQTILDPYLGHEQFTLWAQEWAPYVDVPKSEFGMEYLWHTPGHHFARLIVSMALLVMLGVMVMAVLDWNGWLTG